MQTFRYGPKQLQVIAHEAGGLPAAFRRSRWSALLLPIFFISMLLHTLLAAQKSDLLHAHWTVNGVLAGLVGRLIRRPVITTLRGEDVNRQSTSVLHRALLLSCLRLSSAVVTVSSAMYKGLVETFPNYASKVSFIPNGVQDEFYAIPIGRSNVRVTLLVLGSLLPVKGVHLILSALAESIVITKQWQLVLAGTGPEKERLDAMVQQYGLADQVAFSGQVPPGEISNILAGADILIQASYREGRPNAVIEAMAAGLPVVGSDIDGINEVIIHGENGLLFPAGDVVELTKQLKALIDSRTLREKLGRAARQSLIDQNLTWSGCALAYEEMYRRVLAGEMV